MACYFPAAAFPANLGNTIPGNSDMRSIGRVPGNCPRPARRLSIPAGPAVARPARPLASGQVVVTSPDLPGARRTVTLPKYLLFTQRAVITTIRTLGQRLAGAAVA